MIKLKKLLEDEDPFKFKLLIESMTKYSSLLESPMRIPNWNAKKLYDRTENYAMCKTIRTNGKLVGRYEDYDIYQYIVDDDITDIFTDDGFIKAFFVYEIKHNVMVEKKVWQDNACFGLCRDAIFHYYLPKFEGVISDGLHSQYGERYWNKLLKQASETGYKIYAVDLTTDRSVVLNLNDIDKFYSGGMDSMNYKFLISKK